NGVERRCDCRGAGVLGPLRPVDVVGDARHQAVGARSCIIWHRHFCVLCDHHMTFLYFLRRTHLYLGLFLLPWVVMFGVSSYPINHTGEASAAVWTPVADIPFTADVPAQAESLRPLGEQMMTSAGLSGGGFYVNRPNPRQVNVNHPNFLHPTRIT